MAVEKRTSSGERLRLRTASRCAGHSVRLFLLGWKYLTIPDWSADAMWVPLKVSARMAVSYACKLVSKLNVNVFQAVNSSLVEPVSKRRPSGVHYVVTSGWEKDQHISENDEL